MYEYSRNLEQDIYIYIHSQHKMKCYSQEKM